MQSIVIQVIHRPDGGGAEYLAREISKELSSSKFKSIVIYFNNPKKIKLKEHEYQLGNYSSYNPVNFLKLSFFIFKNSRKYNKIILHGHLTHALYFLVPFSFFSKFELIYTEHNSFNRRRDIKFFWPIERYIYSRYSKIISISPFVQKQLLSWLYKNKVKNFNKNKKFIIILNGSRLFPFSKRNYNKKKFNLLSIGSLTKQKGFDLSIAAVNECREYIEKYIILGEGPEREYLNNLITKLSLNEIVKMPGTKEPKSFLEISDIGLIPSKWEGFGLVSVEMVSSGLPLLITNVKGMSDLFSNFSTVKIVKDRDLSSWIFEIKRVIKNIQSFDNNLKDASKKMNKFSIERMVKNYKKEYLNLLTK